MDVKTGARIAVESERVGERMREGEILEVLGIGDAVHYRVRWDDGHESVFFPAGGSMRIVPRTARVAR
jgi:hypothetical protein